MIRSLLLCICLLMAIQLYEGGIQPAFGDALFRKDRSDTEQPFAWFFGDHLKPVTGCVEASSPEEAKLVSRLAQSAYDAWRIYEIDHPPDTSRSLGDKAIGLDIRWTLVLHPHCNGDEDLSIYFGVQNPRIQAVKGHYESPLGFARLESYNDNTGDGKGFIWIAHVPELLSSRGNLYAILLHEMGHVAGMEHLPGTIMDARIADQISQDYAKKTGYFEQLWGKNMSSSQWIELSTDQVDLPSPYPPLFHGLVKEGSELERALKILTGKDLAGNPIDMRVSLYPEAHPYPRSGELRITGGECFNRNWREVLAFRLLTSCAWSLPISIRSNVNMPFGNLKLFRIRYQGAESSAPVMSQIQTGTVQTESGRSLELLSVRNPNQQAQLFIVVDGMKLSLAKSGYQN